MLGTTFDLWQTFRCYVLPEHVKHHTAPTKVPEARRMGLVLCPYARPDLAFRIPHYHC